MGTRASMRARRVGEGNCRECSAPLGPDDRVYMGVRCRGCYNAWQAEYAKTPHGIRKRLKAQLKFRYGMSLSHWDALMEAQDGRCAICSHEPDGSRGKRDWRLHVDHCHGTGRVRALLCCHCNHVIGKALENPNTLRAAARYVEYHRN